VDYNEHMSSDSAIHNLEYEDFLKQLKHAIDDLPKTQGKVVRLSLFDHLPNKEIATKLSLSEQTVKNSISLGLKALRSRLGNSLLFMFFLFNN
jgi:RNA polymerase sigma factor (sigma-70 family)